MKYRIRLGLFDKPKLVKLMLEPQKKIIDIQIVREGADDDGDGHKHAPSLEVVAAGYETSAAPVLFNAGEGRGWSGMKVAASFNANDARGGGGRGVEDDGNSVHCYSTQGVAVVVGGWHRSTQGWCIAGQSATLWWGKHHVRVPMQARKLALFWFSTRIWRIHAPSVPLPFRLSLSTKTGVALARSSVHDMFDNNLFEFFYFKKKKLLLCVAKEAS
ncbi:hypothetical protein DFP72DRAFT_846436 [Ephemerocybe angulata]|uniref:Uncharacterized protein n=1 Tax=Ephemerocybe angulata TaxID=980116 RepID=A0A8H6M918_9AGAR|nr:hypothetical protein DFP72DRAFT_846436 [Tulosesus angulatus]